MWELSYDMILKNDEQDLEIDLRSMKRYQKKYILLSHLIKNADKVVFFNELLRVAKTSYAYFWQLMDELKKDIPNIPLEKVEKDGKKGYRWVGN